MPAGRLHYPKGFFSPKSVPMSTAPNPSNADRQWFIIGRWQEYDGESRANLLRIIGIGAFYAIHLLNYYGLQLRWLQVPQQQRAAEIHAGVTALAVAWTFVALGILLCLRRRIFPTWLKFVATACDVVLLTAILLAAGGAHSPVVVAYFVVIALAGLRFSLHLVWCATLGSMAGYLFLLGYEKYFLRAESTVPLENPVPRYHQLMFLLALALTGIVLGQVIRRVRNLAEEYAARLAAAGESP
jgi:hypothetical protein